MNDHPEALQARLLNDWQRDLPLVSEPFAAIGAQLGARAGTVLATLRALVANGAVSRVGPVFRPHAVGASTLAAMAVSAAALEATAATVSSFAEVNHNYEREHAVNLWFVATAESQTALITTLERIEAAAGYSLMPLPLVRDYHIDLGFPLYGAAPVARVTSNATSPAPGCAVRDDDSPLIASIQAGIPLIEHPFAAVARRCGWDEQRVIERIAALQAGGIIKRFGIIVRHHELGYRANAMCVWDVPDEATDRLGEALAQAPCVSLCYRRARCLPRWPYNLYCMIHGRERALVDDCIHALVRDFDLQSLPQAVLYSRRRFKQRGAHYRSCAQQPPSAAIDACA